MGRSSIVSQFLAPIFATILVASGALEARARLAPITLFDDLLSGHQGQCLAAGPDSALWVTDDIDQDLGSSGVARIALDGKRTAAYYYVANAYPAGVDIVTGPDGALWFVDEGDADVVRMTVKGDVSYFYIPDDLTTRFRSYSVNYGITVGPDGAIWFPYDGNVMGRVSESRSFSTIYGFPAGAYITDVTTGPDGALWYTDSGTNRIGRLSPEGKITEFGMGISPESNLFSIAPGPDGALWFTEWAGRIGRITTQGIVTEFPLSAGSHAYDIVSGPDGAVWFTEWHPGRIGRVDKQHAISYVPGLASDSKPTCIAAGPDRNMWFVTSQNHVGRVNL